ncbi:MULTISPECIES: hypothetical protein [unclassified Fibrobacter]|uniref:hypothetical protein n=1 Tax=unclassified Fibrobacter TaxID=2634177 RepID=UPI000D6BF562|nr:MULTISPECIES: hypothetical protein [unclassified Fibrobacter]PWJ69007.1 hypothetical protein BGX12_10662 [Fibrobacter sp. UWR4]PZW70853.1 hypothetical protein C8E88_101045 [Fibrobacter sp. UWR1]
MDKLVWLFFVLLVALITSCAGERQGLVCEEIEYRLNTQTYSPDQRAYIEEELRVCREEEAQKKGADAQSRQSIYDRFAASDSTKSSKQEVSVSEALKDSSGQETVSIRDRYKNVSDESSKEPEPAEEPTNEPADASSFQ